MFVYIAIIAEFTIDFDLDDIFALQQEFVILEDNLENLFELGGFGEGRQLKFFGSFDCKDFFEFSFLIV